MARIEAEWIEHDDGHAGGFPHPHYREVEVMDEAAIKRIMGELVDVLGRAQGALHRASEFHTFRDRMNAELHMSPVRWSALTMELGETTGEVRAMILRIERLAAGEFELPFDSGGE